MEDSPIEIIQLDNAYRMTSVKISKDKNFGILGMVIHLSALILSEVRDLFLKVIQ